MERRLAAILVADVVGYSRLMGEDEAGTLAALKSHRSELINPNIARHGGRVVKLMGDGILIEFPSVVEAVQCAFEVQQQMPIRNVDVPKGRRICFRVGVNLGDVIVDGDDIYGDGVNVAARLEGLADPGGILISQAVYGQVRGKLDLAFDDIGKQTVKNIPEPIGVYRILIDGPGTEKFPGRTIWRTEKRKRIVFASAAMILLGAAGMALWTQLWTTAPEPVAVLSGMAYPLPDKPSIAVLPFTNISNDPEQEYFVDGMTDDLITDLSRVSALFVIARNSVFTYKGSAVKVRDVSRELGVRYVLEGSVRKAGEHLRINAQLIDGITGGHVWAERFDRDLEDVFAMQDEIVGRIVHNLKAKLTNRERNNLERKSTNSVEAYDTYLRGIREFIRRSKEGNRNARLLFEEAIELDPEFARAYAQLAWAHVRDFNDAWSMQPNRSLEQAHDTVRRAITIDDSLPVARFVNGLVALLKRKHEEALSAMKKAHTLDPNYSDAYAVTARILNLAGRPEEGLQPMRTAMRLNPHQPQAYFYILGTVYFGLGRYEEAVTAFEKALARNPTAQRTQMWLVATYSKLGRAEDAEWAAEELLALDPEFSMQRISQVLPFKNPSQLETLMDGLRKAGLPD